MKVMLGSQWTDVCPDYDRRANEVRLQVLALQNLEPLEDVYFIRQRSLRTLWNYVREIGPAGVVRKVASRLREDSRNEKYVSCGFGRVLEAPDSGRFRAGQVVVFLAPIAPACLERIVLHQDLLLPAPGAATGALREGELLYLGDVEERTEEERWWRGLRAWTPDSGHYLPRGAAEVTLKESLELLRTADWSAARRLPVADAVISPTLAAQQKRKPRKASGKPSAILFGFGNYAKTTALPHAERHLDVGTIHEIDPTQIPQRVRANYAWDTAAEARDDEQADAFLIASYHHTHAGLASQALRRGAAAVIEKPIATDRSQLRQLLAAMVETGGNVFACFQRRYLRFNEWAREDLGVSKGDPISYHCVVYEVPLPEHHWYRWPNSRSRLVSNGCHWIDHFLYLNDYCDVEDYDVTVAPDGSANCSVTLSNGAFFTMVLTDRGSARVGVREHIELRAGDATVTMEDCSSYQAETGDRVLRRKRVNKLDAYRDMYHSIGERIAKGERGDSLRSVQSSTELVLALEERAGQIASSPPLPVADLVPQPHEVGEGLSGTA